MLAQLHDALDELVELEPKLSSLTAPARAASGSDAARSAEPVATDADAPLPNTTYYVTLHLGG